MTGSPAAADLARKGRFGLRVFAAILAACVLVAGALFWGVREGWNWLSRPHVLPGGSWALHGLTRESWTVVAADSLTLKLPSTHLVAGPLRAGLDRATLGLFAAVGTARIRWRPTPSTGRPPSFPSRLQLPVPVRFSLANLDAAPENGAYAVAARDLTVHSAGIRRARITANRIRLRGLDADASLEIDLDWSSPRDTLRVSAGMVSRTGCCALDSLDFGLRAPAIDLRHARGDLRLVIEDLAAWQGLVPALARAPRLRAIVLDASAAFADFGLVGTLQAEGRGDPWGPILPAARWSLSVLADSISSRAKVLLRTSAESRVHLHVEAPALRNLQDSLAMLRLNGEAHRLSWTVGKRELPLDLTFRSTLTRQGAWAHITTLAGSTILGDAQFDPLRWKARADVAATEPWVVDWVRALSMDAPGSLSARSAPEGIQLAATVRKARLGPVEVDSLAARGFLGDRQIVFENWIWGASGSGSAGSGLVRWGEGDGLWSFLENPGPDGTSRLQVQGDFRGGLALSVRDLDPSALPLPAVRARLPFDLRTSADLRRSGRPVPGGGEQEITRLSGVLRSRPGAESLFVAVEASLSPTQLDVSELTASLGSGRARAAGRASRSHGFWRADSMQIAVERLELGALEGLHRASGGFRGRLHGKMTHGPAAGFVGTMTLRDPARVTSGGSQRTFPSLVLWGHADTLHLGGRLPAGSDTVPFAVSVSRPFDSVRTFTARAFWGNVVALRAQGQMERDHVVHADVRLEGGTVLPVQGLSVHNLDVQGNLAAGPGRDGAPWGWNVELNGRGGRLVALSGNDLDLRFQLRADPEQTVVPRLELMHPFGGGGFRGDARLLRGGEVEVQGRGEGLRLELGAGRRLLVGSVAVGGRWPRGIRADLARVSWSQRRGGAIPVIEAGLGEGWVIAEQHADWRRVRGDLLLDRLVVRKPLAEPLDLLAGLGGRPAARRATSAATRPLLLDIGLHGQGEGLRVDNNLLRSALAVDLRIQGPAEAPTLRGDIQAVSEDGRFGYQGKWFDMRELWVRWDAVPVESGIFVLDGSLPVRRVCGPGGLLEAATCAVTLRGEGSLRDPHLEPPSTTCGDPGDVYRSLLAIARGCWGDTEEEDQGVLGGTAGELALGVGRGQLNSILMEQISDPRRRQGVFLPDTLEITSLPGELGQDILGMRSVVAIDRRIDLFGSYRHSFGAAFTLDETGLPVNDASVGARYRIPFGWTADSAVRARLEDRVLLQVETRRSRAEGAGWENVIVPSLRYQWGFW